METWSPQSGGTQGRHAHRVSELVVGRPRADAGFVQVKVQLVSIRGSSPVGPPLGSPDAAHVTAALAQALLAALYRSLDLTFCRIGLQMPFRKCLQDVLQRASRRSLPSP